MTAQPGEETATLLLLLRLLLLSASTFISVCREKGCGRHLGTETSDTLLLKVLSSSSGRTLMSL